MDYIVFFVTYIEINEFYVLKKPQEFILKTNPIDVVCSG